VSAVLAILVGFDVVDWTQEEIGLVLAGNTAFLGVVAAFTRNAAWGPVSHNRMVREAGGDHDTQV
jgi:hypothetical protein